MAAGSSSPLHSWTDPLGSTCHWNYLPDYLVGAANENQKVKAPEGSGKRFSSVLGDLVCQDVLTTLELQSSFSFSVTKEVINRH